MKLSLLSLSLLGLVGLLSFDGSSVFAQARIAGGRQQQQQGAAGRGDSQQNFRANVTSEIDELRELITSLSQTVGQLQEQNHNLEEQNIKLAERVLAN